MTDLATLWEAGKFAVGSFTWARKELDKKSEYAIARVNNLINRQMPLVRVHRVIGRAPTVTVTGSAELSEAVNALATARRPDMELNKQHALAPSWNGSDVDAIRAETCDFAALEAMRDIARQTRAAMPLVLSACAVVTCPKRRSLLLHRRSGSSATHANKLHILGGAFNPPLQLRKIDIPGDRDSLEFTMLREVFEESRLILRRYDEPICVAQELDTGFIQYVYLGVRITAIQFNQLSQNSEGDLEKVSFDELGRYLATEQDWAPTGRAQILMWLGLGAPGAGWGARFGGKTAKELFDLISA